MCTYAVRRILKCVVHSRYFAVLFSGMWGVWLHKAYCRCSNTSHKPDDELYQGDHNVIILLILCHVVPNPAWTTAYSHGCFHELYCASHFEHPERTSVLFGDFMFNTSACKQTTKVYHNETTTLPRYVATHAMLGRMDISPMILQEQ